jgi:hypothetical protein
MLASEVNGLLCMGVSRIPAVAISRRMARRWGKVIITTLLIDGKSARCRLISPNSSRTRPRANKSQILLIFLKHIDIITKL